MTPARDWLRSRCPDALAAFEQAGAQRLAGYAAGFGADTALPRPPQAADDLVKLAATTWAIVARSCRSIWTSSGNFS